jgi:hypothetical protein
MYYSPQDPSNTMVQQPAVFQARSGTKVYQPIGSSNTTTTSSMPGNTYTRRITREDFCKLTIINGKMSLLLLPTIHWHGSIRRWVQRGEESSPIEGRVERGKTGGAALY